MFNNSLWAVIKMTFKQRMELSWLNLITADPSNIQKSNPWFIEHWEQQDQRTFYRKHMKVNSRIPNQWQNCSLGGYCIYSNVIDCSLVEDNKQQLCSVGRWEQDKTMGKCLLVCDNCIDYGWMHIVWVSGVVWVNMRAAMHNANFIIIRGSKLPGEGGREGCRFLLWQSNIHAGLDLGHVTLQWMKHSTCGRLLVVVTTISKSYQDLKWINILDTIIIIKCTLVSCFNLHSLVRFLSTSKCGHLEGNVQLNRASPCYV